MRTSGRLAAVSAIGLVLAGCQVPPAPTTANAAPPPGRSGAFSDSDSDEYEGWLWRKVTGKEQPATAPPGQANAAGRASNNPVQPASATGPIGPDTPVQALGTSIADAKVKPPEEKHEFDWSDLEPENVWKSVKKATGNGPNETLANNLFKEGEQLYREKKFTEAADKFKAAVDRWPDSVLEEDSLFFQAESYFFADQYGKAYDTFMVLFKKYSNTRYLDVAASRQFAIGRYWEQMHAHSPHWPLTPNFTDKTQPWFDTFGNSINCYESVRLNDPTGPLADDAVMATANAYFVKERYEDAAYHYDILRKDYAKSPFQVQAHLLDLQSKRMCYQGPMYDGKPLDDAEEIARQAVTQFRDQLGAEKPRIIHARQEIREQRAERDWTLGRFYEKKGQYGAARIYYQNLLKEHAGTSFSKMAEQRLGEIKDKPDHPTNYFKWLTGTFDAVNKLP